MNATHGLMLTTREAAEALDVRPSQLARWRRQGAGPTYVRFGRTVRYHPDALKRWRRAADQG